MLLLATILLKTVAISDGCFENHATCAFFKKNQVKLFSVGSCHKLDSGDGLTLVFALVF